jgi:microsomal prostaglandin-E synthase 2
LNITLYQYLICPFCSRVKSYLDYSKIPYSAVEVNPLTKGELQSIDSKLKKVPIAIVDGVVVEDSLAIIRAIGEHDHRSSESFNQLWTIDTDYWSESSEKKLAVMLYPNITRSFEESWECFAYAADVATWNAFMRAAVRVAGPLFMSLANGKIKKKYGIVHEREGDLRSAHLPTAVPT